MIRQIISYCLLAPLGLASFLAANPAWFTQDSVVGHRPPTVPVLVIIGVSLILTGASGVNKTWGRKSMLTGASILLALMPGISVVRGIIGSPMMIEDAVAFSVVLVFVGVLFQPPAD